MPQSVSGRRFEAVQAPDDSWMIIDRATGVPWESEGIPMMGLDRPTALFIEYRLNRDEQPKQEDPDGGMNPHAKA
jgi:hypothetical protein